MSRVMDMLRRLAGSSEPSGLHAERANLVRAYLETERRLQELARLRDHRDQLIAKQRRRELRLRQLDARLGL